MDSDAKLRPLYLAKILYEMTDEDHYLTTAQLIQLLEEKYGIKAHRQTIKAEVELLIMTAFCTMQKPRQRLRESKITTIFA